jgi:hypothetical protein
MVITIENADKKIWDFENKVVEIINAGHKHDTIYIRLNNEGPCLQELRLIGVLENICKTFRWSTTKFIIITSNLAENAGPFKLDIYSDGLYEIAYGQQIKNLIPKNLDTMNHFGIFIGRSNWNRLWLASELYSNYLNKSTITFHFDSGSDYHRPHVGLDEIAIRNIHKVEQAAIFLKNCPITYYEQVRYPIVSPKNFKIINLYSQIFVDIVCETYTSGNTFFPTEKTWRSIIAMTPCIIQGPKHFLKNLQKAGFRTFNNWWDESYDQLDETWRVSEIENLIHILANNSADELKIMYNDMLPTLKHNCDLFYSLSHTQLKNIFNEQK